MRTRIQRELASAVGEIRLASGLLLALAATVGMLAPARAEELRSNDGVAIPLPAGWTRATGKATTAIALERTDAGDPHPAIRVNTLPIQSVDEAGAFKLVREILERPGEVVERSTGRYIKFEIEYPGATSKVKDRFYVAYRNKRVYCFVIETPVARFDEDVQVLESIVDGVQFFVPAPKKEPDPAPTPAPSAPAPTPPTPPQTAPPTTAPVTSPAETSPRPADTAARPTAPGQARPDSALTSATDGDRAQAPERLSTPRPVLPATPFVPPGLDGPAPTSPAADAAPVTTVAVAAKPLVRKAGTKNLLRPGMLVAFDDEYDGEAFGAKQLVDASARGAWCSSPRAHAPHRFVLELPQAIDVARLAFDNAAPDGSGFEGSAAREVVVEGSTTGPDGPWRELGRGVLEKGKDDQPLDLAPNEGRWVRVSVVSNHGHPVLTQLVRIRAFAAETTSAPEPQAVVTTDEGPFRLESMRLSLTKGGPALVEPAAVEPGQVLWLYFKPRAMRLSAEGKYSLEVDLETEDSAGTRRIKPRAVDHTGTPPGANKSTYVSLTLELDPTGYPPGHYSLAIIARDREAKKETREVVKFVVKKSP